MSALLEAIKELLRQQIADEAAREEKLRQRDALTIDLIRLDEAIERRSALLEQLEAPIAAAGAETAPARSEAPPQPKRPPDPLSCRIIHYVGRNTPSLQSDLVVMIQSWTGRDEDWARIKLSNIAEDKADKPRVSRKRAYLLSSWSAGGKTYELSAYGRAALPMVERVLAILQKDSQNLTH